MQTVTVLLSTYNGERYLQEQLQSIWAQQGVRVRVVVRDDGSTDGTLALLRACQAQGRITLLEKSNVGPAKSFMELIRNAPEDAYYALCDQDDVWLPNKLRTALDRLQGVDPQTPALYYGCPQLVDAELRPLPTSKKMRQRMMDIHAILINSNATGCTMVLNRALLELVRAKEPRYYWMHDGWIHKVCVACGGTLFFDDAVPIWYRQHGGNVVGISNSYKKSLKGHVKSLQTKRCSRSQTMRALLECYGDVLSPEKKKILEKAAYYRSGWQGRLRLALDPTIRTGYGARDALFRLAVLWGAY